MSTEKTILRKFNEEGNEVFSRMYGELILNNTSLKKEILYDDKLTSIISNDLVIENIKFETRYELGNYLVKILKEYKSNYSNDAGLWNWLSFFYFDQIYRLNGGKQRERFIFSTDWTNWNKHLVRTPWDLISRMGEEVKFILDVPVYFHTDMCEQITSRSNLILNKNILKLCKYLYYDENKKKFKKNSSKGKPGALFRLNQKMKQYNRIYDLWSISDEKLLNKLLLRKEFSIWNSENTNIPLNVSTSKNPNWDEEECILALNLYFEILNEIDSIDERNKSIINLSKFLNNRGKDLKINQNENFRNPLGVYRKILNFLSIDKPNHKKSKENRSKTDELVWNKFNKDKKKLTKTSLEIYNKYKIS